jgi:hypothetical protein
MAIQVIDKAWITCTQGTCPMQMHATAKGVAAGEAQAVLAANVNIQVPTDGIVTRLNAAGAVAQQLMFAGGQLHGMSTLHGEGGAVIKLPFHKGKLQGNAQFSLGGKKTAEIAFKAGVRAGMSVMYDNHGRLALKGHFHNNLKHGLHVMYNAAGAVVKAEMYVNGTLQAKGKLEAHLESGAMLAGDAAFAAGLTAANSLSAKVPFAAGIQIQADAATEIRVDGGLSAAASLAIKDTSQMAGLAAATLSLAANLAGSFGANMGVFVESRPSATIMDHLPIENIRPFCLCMSPSNPLVAAATAAALGVLTPMPCIPATFSPWIPGAAGVMFNNSIALDNTCQLMCSFGGVITVVDPGQTVLTVP